MEGCRTVSDRGKSQENMEGNAMSKKNYYEAFARVCEENEVWFAVCADGSIEQATYLKDEYDLDITLPPKDVYIGSKEAYDWMVSSINLANTQRKHERKWGPIKQEV